jgi:hypothetical protein
VTAALLNEVDDRAVVAIVADGKIRPVPIPIFANDDLVVGHGMPEHVARDAAFASVALIAVAVRRVLDEVNVALEAVQFVVVHGRSHSCGRRGRASVHLRAVRAGAPRRAPALGGAGRPRYSVGCALSLGSMSRSWTVVSESRAGR